MEKCQGPTFPHRGREIKQPYHWVDELTKKLDTEYDPTSFQSARAGLILRVSGILYPLFWAAKEMGYFLGLDRDGVNILADHEPRLGNEFPHEQEYGVTERYLRLERHGGTVIYFPTEKAIRIALLKKRKTE